jgi:hypothetical protein
MLGLVSLAVALSLTAGARRQQPLEVTGREWVAFDPAARQAWLEGFLAGAAVGQVMQEGAADSSALRTAIATLRRQNGLTFPYGANVYRARVDDFFYWESERPQPVWYAIWVVNRHLKRSQQ